MEISGKQVALFVEKFYDEREFWYPYYRMKEEGAEVTVIGPDKTEFNSKCGMPAQSDVSIGLVSADEFDALIIPGGYAPDHMRRTPAMVEFVKAMHAQGKVIATICHGGWMLASADILRGKHVTSFFAIRDDIVNAGAEWTDDEAVVDGNIITSRTPADLPVFCRAVIKALSD